MSMPDIAVVIPHYQRAAGLLGTALRSAFAQTIAHRIVVIVCDDSSPSPASDEVEAMPELPRHQLIVVRQPNGGAGAARNTALDLVPASVKYVAFLDSDDAWRPEHLANAVHALDLGYDAYFSNFIGVGYPDIGHFERIGNLRTSEHRLIDAERRLYELSCTALEHTISDGGGLIGTPTVVYRYDRFPTLRFRPEFYNGQDFFFWMDLSELRARWSFSYLIECDNGVGVNIYQASGWGTEKSLQRIRNELFVWTSAGRFYKLDEPLRKANRRTIRHLQESAIRDLLHRVRHRRPIAMGLVRDIIRMDPMILAVAPLVPFKVVAHKLLDRSR